MTYIIIILILLYYAYLHDIKGVSAGKEKHLNILFWIFFLLAGLRHGIGGDTYQIRIFWDLLPTWDHFTWKELTSFRYDMGWVLLSFVLKSLFGSFVFLQLLLSLILNIGLFRVIRKYAKYPFVVLLLFFLALEQYFHIECTFMRQAYGVAIFLAWGLEYLNNRKYIKYFITIVICGLFHFSSLALVVLPLFWNMSLSSAKARKHFIIFVLVFAVLAYISFNYTFLSEIKGLARIQDDLENAGSKVETNELVRMFNQSYFLVAYLLVIAWGHRKYGFNIPFKGAVLFSVILVFLAPYVGDLLRLVFFVFICIDLSLSIIVVKYAKGRAVLFLFAILLYTIGSNIHTFQRYSNKEVSFHLYPYYSWFEEEPPSHNRYYRLRYNDGHTISHQIYKYEK